MKKIALFLASAFILMQHNLQAATISQQTAQAVALNFIKVTVPAIGSNTTANLSYTQTESDGVVDFYVFNLSPAKGFVIVAANDNAQPVLAYSTESYFNSNASQFGLGDWIKSTSAKLHYAVLNNIPANNTITYQWTAYINGQNPITSRAAGIGPLCATTWDQEPHYNSLCPFDTADNQRSLTGCVATAMAQIMKYWNYPAQGTGSYSYTDDQANHYSNDYGFQSANFATTFNWAGMPNAVSTDNSPVDTLMYQCAVSVAMDFGDDNQDGSGAFVLQSEAGGGTNPCSQYSYANYFKYNPNTLQGVRMASYTTPDWINLMEAEINAGRVIQYEGDDPTAGGHTWVCDGYQTTGLLHMNWGWGGSANGYFAVGNLNAGGYNFSQNDGALIGIEPLLPVALTITSSHATICPGGNTTLTANGPVGATYTWTPTTGLSCSTCASPVATPSATTLYSVTADSAGVQATTSLAVVITSAVTATFNQTLLPTCTLPENVTFKNTSTNATGYAWDFGDGTTDVVAEPVHAYQNQGVYTVKLYATNACGGDSLIKSQAINITSGPPASSDVNICAGQQATLHATGLSVISWYVANSGGELTTGVNYTTPALSTSTTYYIQSNITPAVATAGPAASTIGTGSYNTRTTKRGMVFNNTVPQKLVSVDVYTDSAGLRSIILQDSIGNILDSIAVSIASGHHTITLNWQLPAEDKLMLCSSGFCYLYRNSSGVTFPYNSSDATLSITGNSSNAPGSFYYFYNWKLQQPACQSAHTPVTVFVLGSNVNSFTATAGASYLVNFVPADTNAVTYAWNFGDGSTSTEKMPQHTYTNNSNYTVSLVVSNGSCADTITQTISTVPSGINQISAFSGFTLFPNPSKEDITLHITSAQTFNNCALSLHNLLGETIFNNSVDITAGSNDMHLNISQLAPGVYIITLQNGKDVLNARFVKSND